MRAAIAELLSSKKFIVGITSSLTAILVRLSVKLNLGIDAETAGQIATTIMVLASAYLVGQGAADFGKSAVKKDDAPTPPAPTASQ